MPRRSTTGRLPSTRLNPNSTHGRYGACGQSGSSQRVQQVASECVHVHTRSHSSMQAGAPRRGTGAWENATCRTRPPRV
eukprot:349608-Chlamydomonas_euryale.AAC.15